MQCWLKELFSLHKTAMQPVGKPGTFALIGNHASFHTAWTAGDSKATVCTSNSSLRSRGFSRFPGTNPQPNIKAL